NRVHPQARRAFQLQRPANKEKTLLRLALRNYQHDAKNLLFGLPGSNITSAEENEKVSSKVESLYAVLVELQRLVIDDPNKVFPGAREFIKNFACLRVFL